MVIEFRKILTAGAMSLLIGGLMACGGAVPPERLPSSNKAEPASAQERQPVKDTASERAVYDSLRAPLGTCGTSNYWNIQSLQGPQGALKEPKEKKETQGASGADGARGPASKGVVRGGSSGNPGPSWTGTKRRGLQFHRWVGYGQR